MWALRFKRRYLCQVRFPVCNLFDMFKFAFLPVVLIHVIIFLSDFSIASVLTFDKQCLKSVH